MEMAGTYAAQVKVYAGQAGATAVQANPPKPVPALAQRLHDMASVLTDLRRRLESTLDRLNGATPEAGSKTLPDGPEPSGALLVANFGATRIQQQLDGLAAQISRLEELA
jgi:hypothetical protein